jgi:transcriptional regulator
MRTNPSYALDDINSIKSLVRAHPFVTIVSDTSAGLVASHYPVLVDDSSDGIVLLGHVGRPDDEVHELGKHEVLVIVQGDHGYISSSWYDRGVPSVPTWNFTVAHLSGLPDILDPAENRRTLARLVDFFEDRLPHPRPMAGIMADAEYAARISSGTVGFRLAVTRFVAKRKLSQDKPTETVAGVISVLEASGPFANPNLAEQMQAELRRR